MKRSSITTQGTPAAPSRDAWLQRLGPLCADLDEDAVRDFVLRMDHEYFGRFSPEDIAQHIRLAARVTLDEPCRVAISAQTDGRYAVVVVAFDYFSEFACLCGLLTAHGLDIREGNIFTTTEGSPATPPASRGAWPPRPRRPRQGGLGRRKIVDYFLVRPLSGASWSPEAQARFQGELAEVIRLLDAHQFKEARFRVNRELVESLSQRRGEGPTLLHPVSIRFDNHTSPQHTVMDIRSTDTPAFLYAFSNALAMRGVYIHQACLENVDHRVHDRLYVRDRHGHKITHPAAQNELRVTAVLIKQFTQFLRWAPDPAKAIEYFDQFLDQILSETTRAGGAKALEFLSKRQTLTMLARLLGASDFLWEEFLRRQHANLLPLLTSYQKLALVRPRAELMRELRQKLSRASSDERRRGLINDFKDREMFRIDMKHLADPSSSLRDFSRALTELAEVVLEETIRAVQHTRSRQHGSPRLSDGTLCPFAVFGLGKFGGGELGYASDIEVVFVYKAGGRTSGKSGIDLSEYFERVARDILQWIEAKQEGIFHVDVRLRPHGGKGPLANTLHELKTYYGPGGLSAPFERQALIKLRHVAGDPALGRAVERLRDTVVYSGAPWDLKEAVEVRRAQIAQLVDPATINVKHSPGGLIDVEYAVQYLQLIHGHRHKALRTPNTLAALAALARLGLVSQQDGEALRDAYLLFRALIDGLRIVRGNAKDLVLPPAGSEAFIFLARRVGYTSDDWQAGAARLEADLAAHMANTRAFYEGRFGRLRGAPSGAAALGQAPPARQASRGK